MRYTVEILPKAEKFLRTLTDVRLYRRLGDAIDALIETPRPSPMGVREAGRRN